MLARPNGIRRRVQTGRDAPDLSLSLSLRLVARYVLEIPDVAGTEPDPPTALDTAFTYLRRGWPDL